MMFLFLLACGSVDAPPQKKTVKEDVQNIESDNHTSRIDTLVQTLSARDQQLSCSMLTLETTLQAELTTIVDTVQRPPWVPMRAAACIAELYPNTSQSDLSRWIVDPQKKGLAFLIAGLVPKLPDDVARLIVLEGLSGPHEHQVRIRLKKLHDPRITPLLSAP
jgi:hypothetical protein